MKRREGGKEEKKRSWDVLEDNREGDGGLGRTQAREQQSTCRVTVTRRSGWGWEERAGNNAARAARRESTQCAAQHSTSGRSGDPVHVTGHARHSAWRVPLSPKQAHHQNSNNSTTPQLHISPKATFRHGDLYGNNAVSGTAKEPVYTHPAGYHERRRDHHRPTTANTPASTSRRTPAEACPGRDGEHQEP